MESNRKRWHERPVVFERKKLGREINTAQTPLSDTDLVVTRRVLKQTDEEGGETYHEGYIDGKLYLVPDSNLQIMKDLVNLNVRRKAYSKFLRDPYEEKGQVTHDKYWARLRKLSRKINDLEDAEVLEMKEEFEEDEEERVNKAKFKRKNLSTDMESGPFRLVPFDVKTKRFLVSGHIRPGDSQPVFMLQRYVGRSPFWRRVVDFSKIETSNEDVNLFIKGRFFQQSVLKEKNGVYKAMILAPDLSIQIDERSRIYLSSFFEVVETPIVDVRIEGKFLQERGHQRYTPIVTFTIHKHSNQLKRCWRRCKACYMKNVPSFALCNHETTVSYQTATEVVGEQDSKHEISLKINQSRERIYCDSCRREICDEEWASSEGKREDEHKFLKKLETNLNVDQKSEEDSRISENETNLKINKNREPRYCDSSQRETSEEEWASDEGKGEDEEQKFLNTSEKDSNVDQQSRTYTDASFSFERNKPETSYEPNLKPLSSTSSLHLAKLEQGDVKKDLPVFLEYRCEVRKKKKESLLRNVCRTLARGSSSNMEKKKTVITEIESDSKEDVEANHALEYRCIVRPKKSRLQNDSVLNKIIERGRREREMVSVDLSSEGSTTTMHEGYEVQKKYLVPDSNLLEMKKLVELKLKGDPIKPGYTGSPHYKRPKYSIDEDDNLTGDDLYSIDRKSVEDPKKGEKQDRVTRVLFDESTFEDETDILENKGYISNNDVKEPGDNILEDESRDDTLGSDKRSKSNTSIKTDEFEVDPEIKTVPTHEDADKRSKPNTSIKTDEFEVDPEVDTVPTHKDSENKRFSTPIKNYDNSQFESKDSNIPYKREIYKKKEVFEPYSDNYKPRILLSGHLRKNFKPIFIIHKYSGESLFGEKSPDFLDSKIESEVELFISGKFYKHSILEELNGYPNSLLINKRRIPIGDGCKVFEDSVYQMFGIGDIGVELEAKFIKAVHLRKYTPFLTLKVHRLTSLEPNSISGSSGSINKPLITLDRQLTYYVQKPESKNVFNTDQQNQKEDKLEQDSILDSRGSIRNPFITLDRQLAYYVQNTNTKQTLNIDSQKQRSSMKCKDCNIKSVPSFVLGNFQNHEITVNYQTATALDGERHSEHENNFEMNQSREQIYCDSCLREMRAKAASCEGRGEDKQKCLNVSETVANIDQRSKSESSINEPFKNVEKSDFDYLGRSENENNVQASDSQTDITLSVKSLSVSSSLQPAKKEQGAVQKCFPVLEYKCEVRNKNYRNVVRNTKKVSLLQTFCRALGRGKQKKCSARKKKKTVKLEIRNDFEEDAEVNKSHEYRCIVRPKKSRSQNDSSVLSKINKWFCQNK